ncbi:MAG TPA: DeoR/GlpR family DNA-binding transcription regulator [Flavihumibacter sp.]|jgi:DeoR/GlpR family transcriptional regulator of sugar metabolism
MKADVSNMLKNERHAYILKQVNLHNKVLSTDLALELKVSDDTIRRDLAEMAENGEIIKVHGGALSKSYHYSNHQTNVYAVTQKREIARKAIGLLKNGMTVLTEAGTTMLEMVRAIPKNLEATFFTVSPLMALELAEHPKLTVILLGGQLDNAAQICIGEKLVNDLSEIKVDLCFLGANAIDSKEGITEQDWRIVHVKKAMLRASSKVAILTISEKLNSTHKLKLCPPQEIDYLITELKPTDKKLVQYRKHMEVI